MPKAKSAPAMERTVSTDEMVSMLEVQRDHLQEKMNRLSRVISELMGAQGEEGMVMRDGGPVKDNAPIATANHSRPQMSVAARKKISQAQKKRWAKVRADKNS